jgi:hypothetical protein
MQYPCALEPTPLTHFITDAIALKVPREQGKRDDGGLELVRRCLYWGGGGGGGGRFHQGVLFHHAFPFSYRGYCAASLKVCNDPYESRVA